MLLEKYLLTLKSVINNISPIPESEWEDFQSIFELSFCKKGSNLDQQGYQCKNVHFILSGLFTLVQTTDRGNDITKNFLFENCFISDLESILGKVPSKNSSKALEDSTVLTAPYLKVAQFYSRHICWERVGRKMLEKVIIDKNNREYDLIALSAKERYESFKKQFSVNLHRIPKKYIASYLGIKPETLSRILKKEFILKNALIQSL